MKKILALVLALVMTMSLATISSGAAFSDADKVQYTDAVNTLSALGVLGGYADGSIRPAADVTRGAAAKMVAMVATGSSATTIGYYKGTSSFADVPATHTFADAVAFCVARGIVAGYGDGNYGVADNVKGWAVAKMVLVAMGYDAKAYGMEGAGSALNTITLASQLGLFKGMAADFNATEAASREECAQIVYNALSVDGVMKGYVNSDGSYTYTDSGKCLLDNYGTAVNTIADKAAAKTALKVAQVTANKATGAAYGYTELGSVKLTNETGLDMVGHYVAYVDSGAYNADGSITAFNVVDLSKVVDVYTDITKKADYEAAFGTTTIAIDAAGNNANVLDLLALKDYSTTGASAPAKFADGATKATSAGTYVLYNDTVVAYLTATTTVGYVSDFSAGNTANDGFVKVSVEDSVTSYAIETSNTSIANKEVTKVAYYDGIAKGDIVLVNKTGELTTVTKAATVTGKVSAVNNTANAATITIGGTEYAQSWNMTNAASDVLASANASNYVALGSALGQEVVAYVDAYGAVFAMTKVAAATTDAGVVYVAAAYKVAAANNAYGEAGGYTYYAQCVDMDGKEVSYQISEATYNDIMNVRYATVDAANEVGLSKVTLAYDDGVKATCATFSSAAGAEGAYKFVSGATTSSTALKIGSDYYASDVKTIYVAYTGSTLDTLFVEVKAGVQDLTGAEYYAVKNGSNNDIKYIVKAGYSSTSVASTDVVYVAAGIDASAAEGIQTAKTESYINSYNQPATAYVYDVYVNGTLTSIKATNSSLAAAGFYKYTTDSLTGIATFSALESTATLVLDTSAVVDGLYGTLLSFDLVDDAEAKDAKIVDVRYALASADAKANMVEITSLSGLMPDATMNEVAGATIAVVYNVSGTAKTVATIYVLAAPVKAGAVVGNTGYATLAAAIAAAEDGDVIELAGDVVLDSYLTIGKDITIDLNGNDITRVGGTALYVNNASAVVTIQGEGTISGDQAVYVAAGQVDILGGSYHSDGDTIYVMGTGKVNIYDGEFSADASSHTGDTYCVLNQRDADRATSSITVYGGTFVGFNPANNASEGAGTNFVASGYASVQAGSNFVVGPAA